MAEVQTYTFEFKEIVEALIKQQDLHEGTWQIYVEFGIAAGNMGPSANELRPSAVVPIQRIGILRVEKETNLAVNAAQVNPK